MAPLSAQRMRTLKLTLAYDGSKFSGWQRQKNARSVQATLEQAFQRILGERVKVVGAGRTDSGVHAEGQVAHAMVRSTLHLKILQRALNALLPEDLLVRSIQLAPKRFHARYWAKAKRYRYTIVNSPLRPLFDRGRVLHIPAPLDTGAMQRVCRFLRGRHDFRAFCSEAGGRNGSTSFSRSHGRPVCPTVRNLQMLTVRSLQGRILIDAQADGFLYHMVRRIVGLLIEAGKGRIPSRIVRQLLQGEERIVAPTAPAQGLCLVKVIYR